MPLARYSGLLAFLWGYPFQYTIAGIDFACASNCAKDKCQVVRTKSLPLHDYFLAKLFYFPFRSVTGNNGLRQTREIWEIQYQCDDLAMQKQMTWTIDWLIFSPSIIKKVMQFCEQFFCENNIARLVPRKKVCPRKNWVRFQNFIGQAEKFIAFSILFTTPFGPLSNVPILTYFPNQWALFCTPKIALLNIKITKTTLSATKRLAKALAKN